MPYKNKEDQKASSRRNYLRNQEAIKARAAQNNRRQALVLKDYLRDVKAAPCTDCGVQYPHYVMDFDHVADDKLYNVSNMVETGYSLKTVKAEIEKCELVCSNCHRQRTWDRRSQNKYSEDAGSSPAPPAVSFRSEPGLVQ